MPYQPFNYSNIPLNDPNRQIQNTFSTMIMPQQFKNQAALQQAQADQTRQNANMARMQAEMYPQMFEIERALKQREIQKYDWLLNYLGAGQGMQGMQGMEGGMPGMVEVETSDYMGPTGEETQQMFSQYLSGDELPMEDMAGKVSRGSRQERMLSQDPFVRGLLNKEFNVPFETPTEKRQAEIDVDRAKQEQTKRIEQQYGTSAQMSKMQEKMTGISNLGPVINELVNFEFAKGQDIFGGLADKAKGPEYESLVKEASESLVKARGLNVTDSTIKDAKDILKRKPREPVDAYRNRLLNTYSRFLDEYEEYTGEKPEDYGLSAKKNKKEEGQFVKMKGPDGKLYKIPASKSQEYTKIGGVIVK